MKLAAEGGGNQGPVAIKKTVFLRYWDFHVKVKTVGET